MILGPGSRISKPRSSRRSQYSKALPNDLPRHWALMIAIAHAGPSSRFSRSRRRLGINQASTHRRVASGCRSSYFSRSTFAEALLPWPTGRQALDQQDCSEQVGLEDPVKVCRIDDDADSDQQRAEHRFRHRHDEGADYSARTFAGAMEVVLLAGSTA